MSYSDKNTRILLTFCLNFTVSILVLFFLLYFVFTEGGDQGWYNFVTPRIILGALGFAIFMTLVFEIGKKD